MSDLTPKGFSNGQYVDRYLLRDKLYQEDAITMGGAAILNEFPAADVVEIPEEGIEFLSDGYHTFNSLYFQRLVLFAALVKAYKDRAWKSWKHEDGEPCFGGGWFIVGIDTAHGSYTYHYEGKDFDLFECEELPVAKHWDGHTEAHVTRLLSLPDVVELRPRPLRMLEKMIREAKGETETPAEAPAPGAHAEEDLKKMTKGQLIELVKNQDGDIARLHQHYGEACMKEAK